MSTADVVDPDLAVAATNQHYELPAQVFAAYLDPRLKYSSGIYAGPDTTLAEAQTAKLHLIARRLGLTGGERLLDAGCGWGSLILFMATEYGCHATGVTPSRTQAAYIDDLARTMGVRDRIDIRLGRFAEVSTDGDYAAATMVGSIIHMPDREQVLTRLRAMLARGGRLYLSESCFRNAAVYREFNDRPGTRHVMENIFGFADMVPLSVLVAAVETAGFSLTGLDDLTAHYKRTIADWERNAETNRDAIEQALPGGFEPLIRYLRTANAGWGYTAKHYALTAANLRLGPEGTP
ncbi:SAM-dependent methyltransferase [Winogradskya humida]|uniref:Cyclopropane-fatty-acyl-phospholipid synthase n=1 Tax=Winogradskya humida TaxID=113566 RepID=A0ABQ4A612_9ACTN|nr:class I SAM-dependent methyltransferase [Actinoplanes humidus]GIE26154.1 hypothetical protein Ahu01nite_092560 [Actinoplanes humidus]